MLGAVLAVLVLVNKSLNDAVHLARAASDLPGCRTGPVRPHPGPPRCAGCGD